MICNYVYKPWEEENLANKHSLVLMNFFRTVRAATPLVLVERKIVHKLLEEKVLYAYMRAMLEDGKENFDLGKSKYRG